MNADVTVRDMMDREYVGVSESDDLVDTVELLLREEAETAIVQRGSEHVGVLTERDVLASIVEGPDPEDATVGDVMTASVPTVSPEETLDIAADRMSAQESRRLVVTNGTEPLGIISERDLLATRTADIEQSTVEQSRQAVVAGQAGNSTEAMTEASVEYQESYEDQSICERCGTFTGDLSSFNGQLLCPDCRDM